MHSEQIWLLKDGEPLPHENKGQSLRTGNLARAFDRLGFEVLWFVSSFEHGQKKQRASQTALLDVTDSYRLAVLQGPGYASNMSIGRVWHQFITAQEFLKLAATLPKPKLIVSAYPTPELNFAAGRFAAKHQIPFFVDIRDPWPDIFPKRLSVWPLKLIYRYLFRAALQKAAGLISMSDRMLAWGLGYAQRPSTSHDAVFHLGSTASDNPDPVINSVEFSEDQPLVCAYYAMFGKLHRGDVIVQAAKILHARAERRVRFVFIGDGEFKMQWQSELQGNPLVSFTGWLGKQDAAAKLREAHIGIIAIGQEVAEVWFGNKYFEYLEAGLALINNTTSEIREIIVEKRLGRQFEGLDAQDLVKQLDWFLDNPAALNECRANGLRLYREKYETTALYEGYARHVLGVCDGSCASRAVSNF